MFFHLAYSEEVNTSMIKIRPIREKKKRAPAESIILLLGIYL
jgi:hypothetical protein